MGNFSPPDMRMRPQTAADAVDHKKKLGPIFGNLETTYKNTARHYQLAHRERTQAAAKFRRWKTVKKYVCRRNFIGGF